MAFALVAAPSFAADDYEFPRGQRACWEFNTGVGSKHYWEAWNGVGSRNYWLKGSEPGSLTYWENWRGPGSKDHWENGNGFGSRNHWLNGRGPGSKHAWLNETGCIDGRLLPILFHLGILTGDAKLDEKKEQASLSLHSMDNALALMDGSPDRERTISDEDTVMRPLAAPDSLNDGESRAPSDVAI